MGAALWRQGPLKVDLDVLEARLRRLYYVFVAQSLREIQVYSIADFFTGYAGRKSDLGPWLEGAEINRDGDLRLQYLVGWGLNSALENVIYRKMLEYRRSPANLFTGSPERVQTLLNANGDVG